MTELQKKILATLGPNTYSGVKDLSEPTFIETEIRSIEKSLEFHLYGTLLYSFIFIFQVFNTLKDWPEKSIIYLIIYFSQWLVSLYFLHTWFKKKQSQKFLKLLLATHLKKVNIEEWVLSHQQIISGWFWPFYSKKRNSLELLEERRKTKLLHFITELILVGSFTFMAINKGGPMVYGVPLCMGLSILTFLDWKVHTYIFTIKNLTFYSPEPVAFQE